MKTAEVHSGIENSWSIISVLPLSGTTYSHDFHHSHNNGAYGSFFTFWDFVTQSDVEFK
jgi:sterol desaturase/sphingolipid hydroxylase (fatty acid hydroxylase superfamily)